MTLSLAARVALRCTGAMTKGAAWLAALLLALTFIILIVEFASRNLFSHSFAGSWELASFLMAGMFFLGLAPALEAGTHVRVMMLPAAVTGRASTVLNAVIYGVAFTVSAFAAYALFDLAFISLSRGALSWELSIPLFVPQFVIAAGIGLLALVFIARFLAVISAQTITEPES